MILDYGLAKEFEEGLDEEEGEAEEGGEGDEVEDEVNPVAHGDVDAAEEAPVGAGEAFALAPELKQGGRLRAPAEDGDEGVPAEQVAIEDEVAIIPPGRDEEGGEENQR